MTQRDISEMQNIISPLTLLTGLYEGFIGLRQHKVTNIQVLALKKCPKSGTLPADTNMHFCGWEHQSHAEQEVFLDGALPPTPSLKKSAVSL